MPFQGQRLPREEEALKSLSLPLGRLSYEWHLSKRASLLSSIYTYKHAPGVQRLSATIRGSCNIRETSVQATVGLEKFQHIENHPGYDEEPSNPPIAEDPPLAPETSRP